ncbi:MAG TPA: hypothetical protein VFV73_12895 [Streptosporangiaceae bacterium]|nr:hypothetical protein [Streptosporangiaceae bacterium]
MRDLDGLSGLFVEHYQNYVQWNGNGGETLFFQNEMPCDSAGGATPSNTTPVDVTSYPWPVTKTSGPA